MYGTLIETNTGPMALVGTTDSSLSSSTYSLSSSDSDSSDYSDIPTFVYDTGATGSYGSHKTPLDQSRQACRHIKGIGGIQITADREGRCKAIPNVATSKRITRNLASVSQLTQHYNNTIAFDGEHAYAIPPQCMPIDGADIVGTVTSNGLYTMHMKNFERHTHKIHTHKIQLTALSAGEAAQSSIHASNASKMNKTKTYSSRYDFLNEDLPCLDCYFHANEVANPVQQDRQCGYGKTIRNIGKGI